MHLLCLPVGEGVDGGRWGEWRGEGKKNRKKEGIKNRMNSLIPALPLKKASSRQSGVVGYGVGGCCSCRHMEVISPHVASLKPADASLGRCLFTQDGLQILKLAILMHRRNRHVPSTSWCSVTF